MNKFPFSVYDFFAYLTSGAVVVATVDTLWGPHWLMAQPPSAEHLVLLAFLSYLFGQIAGHISGVLLETIFARRILGIPSAILMAKLPPKRHHRLFSAYFAPLPKEVIDRIAQNAEIRAFPGSGESLFIHAFSVVTKDAKARERLDDFRNQYGFARNMTLALFVVSILFVLHVIFEVNSPVNWKWISATIGLSVGLLYRFLFFYRQYSFQLFVDYSERRPDFK